MTIYTKKNGVYQPRRGEGYALFDCNAPKDQIDSYIRGRAIENPAVCSHDHPKPYQLGLELRLQEVNEFLESRDADPALVETIRKEEAWSTYPSAYKHLMNSAKPTPLKNLKYIITARNNKTNADVCEKLTTVMNDVSLKFGEEKPFTVMVLGKDDQGQYQPWTND